MPAVGGLMMIKTKRCGVYESRAGAKIWASLTPGKFKREKYREYKDMRPGKESIKRRACHPPFF
jgi:hypothetical protein